MEFEIQFPSPEWRKDSQLECGRMTPNLSVEGE